RDVACQSQIPDHPEWILDGAIHGHPADAPVGGSKAAGVQECPARRFVMCLNSPQLARRKRESIDTVDETDADGLPMPQQKARFERRRSILAVASRAGQAAGMLDPQEVLRDFSAARRPARRPPD